MRMITRYEEQIEKKLSWLTYCEILGQENDYQLLKIWVFSASLLELSEAVMLVRLPIYVIYL